MSRAASDRVIDASAALPPADRALVNMWVGRRLDDAAVARMTGVSEAAIAGRRARIVAELSAALDLPAASIQEVLAEPEPAVAEPVPAVAEPEPAVAEPEPAVAEPEPAVAEPEPALAEPEQALAQPEPAAARPEPEPEQPGRRRPVALAVPLLLVAAAVVSIVALTGGGGGHPGSAAGGSPGSGAGSAGGVPLVALTGGPPHASGSVRIRRGGRRPRLTLSVAHLPGPAHGHYEVWLYNSVIYSEALGQLPAGASRFSADLPANAGRFHWIDVSVQPQGHTFHSGESVLRAPNPLAGTASGSTST